MRFPPNWPMELLLVVALFVSIVIVIFAVQEAPGDRTRFTLERSDAVQFIGQRRLPVVAEDAGIGR